MTRTARTTAPELPGFVHLSWLGGGGFADVFRYQDAMGRSVAVKVLHRGVDEGASTTFRAEASLMAKLSTHPNIVTIHQSGVASDGRPFLVMEECSVTHLGDRISKRVQSVSKAMEITIQIAGAVETAHRMGILHRDVKPANILFTDFGRPSLTDFGISVATGEAAKAGGGLSPLWAPPEQHPNSGQAMGPWSDVFSLAATMWAMLVGHSPLEDPGGANDQLSLRHRIRTFTAPATGRSDVPEVLERVLATALARDPEQRYSSALEFARAIQGVQGLVNESITPIDVLSEGAQSHAVDAELSETGTRVSGFLLIDPDRGDGSITATATGPSGDDTQLHDSLWNRTGGTEEGQIIQHGRGSGTPGLRDFTGPPVPKERGPVPGHDEPDAAQAKDAAETEEKKVRIGGTLIVVGVAILVASIVAALFASGALDWEPGDDATMDPTPTTRDPISVRVPPVGDLTGSLTGEQVTFTWTNPDPRPGDTYMFEELSTSEASATEFVEDETVVVDARPGQTCIEVSLRRTSGQISAPTRECVES